MNAAGAIPGDGFEQGERQAPRHGAALSVDRIADHAGVARRTLERAFQTALHRGIRRAFQRRRMEKAREMLVQTDLQIADLAAGPGVISPTQFGRAFRSAFRRSPGQCRRDHRAAE